jgi:lipoyl(octanoyl) transferase
MEVRWISRGGGCVVHALGQLAIYPIIPLARIGLGLAEYRARLEESIVAACREHRVPAWRRADAPGVWCRQGQVGQLGIAVRSWVAYHGLFLNVCPAMEVVRLARPADANEPIASLAVERVRPTSMHSVRESVVRHLAVNLGYEKFHLYTGHPLLRRSRRRVYVGA